MKSKRVRCDIVEIELIMGDVCTGFSLLNKVADTTNNFCYMVCFTSVGSYGLVVAS
jgi:hypothetical protein